MPFFTISCAARSIALPRPCSVREPPVGLATRLKSGSEVRRRNFSIGMPSTPETICAKVVSWPWPWLCEAVRSVTRAVLLPGDVRLVVGREAAGGGGLDVGGDAAAAQLARASALAVRRASKPVPVCILRAPCASTPSKSPQSYSKPATIL